MTKTVSLAASCTCNDKKQFIHSVKVEKSKNGTELESIQVECPFRNEKNCSGHVTLQLPAGMKVKEDKIGLRK